MRNDPATFTAIVPQGNAFPNAPETRLLHQ